MLLIKQCVRTSRRSLAAAESLSTLCDARIAVQKSSTRPKSFRHFKFFTTTSDPHSLRVRCFSSAVQVDYSDGENDEKSVIPFLLADIGEGIKEVELLQWFVQEGDHVQQFDRVCEVQSDKATVEISSRYDGTIHSLSGGKVGDMVAVGSPLVHIRVEGGQDVGSEASPPAEEAVLHSHDSSDSQLRIPNVASQFHLDSDDEDGFGTVTEGSSTAKSLGKFLATPAVRKLGMEHNLDLSTLVGTGPRGRVLKADVLNYLKIGSATSDSSSRVGSEPFTEVGTTATGPPPFLLEEKVVTLKGYSRLMIQTMTASREIPHMGFTDEFEVTKLVEFRKELSPKVSVLAFFLKATSLALKEYPMINASWKDIDKGQATMWANHNIGVAMDTPRGLVVPVVRNCQDKSLVEIQEDLSNLKEIGATGKLGEEHLRGATFTLSNIGSVGGGTYMNPLIVPPQAAIGAMGAMQTLPRFDKDGEVTAAKIINVSWAGDHRMIDGATLARFSNRCKKYLQDPVQMLVSMK